MIDDENDNKVGLSAYHVISADSVAAQLSVDPDHGASNMTDATLTALPEEAP